MEGTVRLPRTGDEFLRFTRYVSDNSEGSMHFEGLFHPLLFLSSGYVTFGKFNPTYDG